jgi:hypothetical protein
MQRLLTMVPAGVQFNEHLEGDSAAIFALACKLGCEGIVSRHRHHPYRSGPSKGWLKIKNPAAPGVLRGVRSGAAILGLVLISCRLPALVGRPKACHFADMLGSTGRRTARHYRPCTAKEVEGRNRGSRAGASELHVEYSN